METANHPAHCYLRRVLTEEEVDRVRTLLRQQGIHLPDANRIGLIEKDGSRRDCPFRYSVGSLIQVCTNGCHLANIFGEHKV
jgi:hypothetical protein